MNKKAKQISFLSAIVILVSGTIGSGIFFKNASLFKLGHGNIGFVLAAWILVAFGVIAFGIGIAEMSSKSKGSKGILEWTQKFLPKRAYLSSKNFLQIIFIPILLFALPIYATKAIGDIDGIYLTGWSAAGIAYAFFIWFAFMTYVSLRATEGFQWLTMIIKFIPLFVLPILSFVSKSSETSTHYYSISQPSGLSGYGNGAMLLIAGIPSIFFSFDGFYTVTTLKDKMEKPNKFKFVIPIGLALVTIIYLWVSLSFMNGSKTGKYTDLQFFLNREGAKKAFGALIAIGVLGVVNGYVQFGTRTYLALHEENESPITTWFEKNIYRNKLKGKLSSLTTMSIISSLLFLTFTLIGIYGWDSQISGDKVASYQHLLAFDDTITDFKSLLVFALIGLALAYATKSFDKTTVKGKSIFVLSWIAITFIGAAFIFQYIAAIVDLTGFNSAKASTSEIVKLSLLCGIPIVSVILGSLELKFRKK